MSKRKFSWIHYVILATAIIILILPSLIRITNSQPVMPGDEAYYHARMAETIIDEGVPSTDNLSFSQRNYLINPYHFVLASFTYILGVELASVILPILLGILSLFLFYNILKILKIDNLTTFFTILVFIFSPIFLTTFGVSSDNALILFLVLLSFWMYTRKKAYCDLLSGLSLLILALFGVIPTLVAGASIFSYSLLTKKPLNKRYILFGILAVILFSYNLPFTLNYEAPNFINEVLLEEFVADFGGWLGLSLFMIILAPVGMYLLWTDSKKQRLLILISLFFIVYSFFNKNAIIYSNLFIVLFSGIALSTLATMKWKFPPVRVFTLTILFCGLVLSLFSHINLVSEALPNKELITGLTWIKEKTPENSLIFSHYSNGFWIQYYAKRVVFMDPLLRDTPNINYLNDVSTDIFGSNDLKFTSESLTKQGVDYVLITKNMHRGLVWQKEDKGLAFLLRNTETFKKRYSNYFIDIREYR